MTSSETGNSSNRNGLTTKAFWDHTWHGATGGGKRERRLRRLETLDWQLGRLLVDSVRRVQSHTRRVRILEVGCGNSIWLPYLGREIGAEVVGVDFSERGCRLEELNLEAMGVSGTIICDDLFAYAQKNPPTFDAVISFGFIEHFTDVADILRTMAELLCPGGVLFASVPNFAGIYGSLQGVIDAQVLSQHVILRPKTLAQHGRDAGLVDVESGYMGGPLRLGLLNFAHLAWMPAVLSRLISRGLFELDYTVSCMFRLSGARGIRPSTAPYVYLRGEKSKICP